MGVVQTESSIEGCRCRHIVSNVLLCLLSPETCLVANVIFDEPLANLQRFGEVLTLAELPLLGEQGPCLAQLLFLLFLEVFEPFKGGDSGVPQVMDDLVDKQHRVRVPSLVAVLQKMIGLGRCIRAQLLVSARLLPEQGLLIVNFHGAAGEEFVTFTGKIRVTIVDFGRALSALLDSWFLVLLS